MSDGTHRRALAALALGSMGFARDARFAPPAERAADDPVPAVDREAEAYARGYTDGAADAQAAVAAADAARDRIESALERIDAAQAEVFAQRLKDTVLALCQTVLDDIGTAPEALARRVALAAAMFARADDERVIRLHPEDLALVHARLPETWHCEPDPLLERGALRIETGSGGVEQGPAQWRAALEAALRAC